MILNVTFDHEIQYDDCLKTCVSVGSKKGQKIQRDSFEEQPYFQNLKFHKDNNKIQKDLYNHILLKGKIKAYWEWTEEEGITQKDVEFLQKIYETENPEDSDAYQDINTQDRKYFFETEYKGLVSDWHPCSVNWSLASTKAGVEILEDDTLLLCCIQSEYGWNFDNIDIPAGETITANKKGNQCYLFYSNLCEVSVNSSDVIDEVFTYKPKQFEVQQLTSPSCQVKNITDEPFKLIMISK